MRNISFALTVPQFLAGTKNVTRRMGWQDLKPGDKLCVVVKSQGLKKGEAIERIGYIEIISVERERLNKIIAFPVYGRSECMLEGFPNMRPSDFVRFFCKTHAHCFPDSFVTRIEFRKIEKP